MATILLGLGVPSCIIMAIYCIAKYYTNIKIFLNDILHQFASITRWGIRTSIRGDIQLISNKSIKDLNNIVPELQMPKMEIEWVKEDENGQVRFDKNKAIVMLKFNKDRTQNVINSTSAYIHNTLLTTARSFMDEPIVKAIDYTLIHKFLQNTPQRRFATRKFVETNRQEILQYRDNFEKVNIVDKQGLLTHILLREYTTWGDHIITDLPSEEHKNESRAVLDFVYDIASRGYDELTPLQLKKNNIKIAVLLVAKTEIYNEFGSRPYLRRIREGFTSGINTFYLLARGEKINILNNVYTDLIQTGNFSCLNNPEVFLDHEGRENICYCLEVDNSGDMASDYSEINESIENANEIELSIEHVYQEELKCLYNGRIQVSIPKEEICGQKIRLRNYYVSGMTINAIPISIGTGGVVKASLKDTDCNPQNLIDNEYAVGNIVKAIVQEVEDDIVRLLISSSDKQAYAFRRDLTYSKYLFLHNLYPVGSEYEFEIIDIDYISNQLRLARKDLIDPWSICDVKVGQTITITIYKIEGTYFASEINNGIKIILPYSELAWLESEVENERKRIKLNKEVEITVKQVDTKRRIIIASHRPQKNPYNQLYESLDSSKIVKVRLHKNDSYGITGSINELKVFIPISETHIANNHFYFKIGQEYNTYIKHVADDGRSLIGSFKPFIKHPLSVFAENYKEGDIIQNLTISQVDERIHLVKLNNRKFHDCRLSLHISEVSNIAFINEFKKLKLLINAAPLMVKQINYENNRVDLSLRSVLSKNNEERRKMNYDTTYEGIVTSAKDGKYVIIIISHWIEGYLDTSTLHNVGDNVFVQLAAYGSEYAVFYED